MNYLNLELKNLLSDEFIGSEPLDRATWLCLMRYCALQETGGVIKGVRTWGERRLIGVLSVTKDETRRSSKLWEWHGDDLVVWGYPVEQEVACQARREAGKKYGRGHPKALRKEAKKDTNSSPNSPPNSSPMDKEKKRKERENKVIEGNGKKSRVRFAPPNPEEVDTYGKSINFNIDGRYFCDYYLTRGWKLKGGSPMKDWQAAVRTWKKRAEAKTAKENQRWAT